MKKVALLPLLLLVSLAHAQYKFTVLHNFGNGSDGVGLWSRVAFDQQGNLYGTTTGGGDYNDGTVFQLAPQDSGEWNETVMHSFPSSPEDGIGPWGGPVVDSSGNVYGTTQQDGKYLRGVVYELTPGIGGWSESIIHSFYGPGDPTGSSWANPALDKTGNLYGSAGNVFELSPGDDGWSEKLVHFFTGNSGDGYEPGAPIVDIEGNLFGATFGGGGSQECPFTLGCGTVYELRPVKEGVWGPRVFLWKEYILHRFGYSRGDGSWPPNAPLAMDSLGNLYGTTENGGNRGGGTVYELASPPHYSGAWRETILYSFDDDSEGNFPAGVVTDKEGNLYGTTAFGGPSGCACGVVFKLTRLENGGWQYNVVHAFGGYADGDQPAAGPTLGPDGNLYGTTLFGGRYGGGVVFQIQLAP